MDSLTDRQHSQTEAVRQTERSNNLEKDRQTGDRWSHTDRKDGYAQIDWETDRPIHTDTQHKWTHTLLSTFVSSCSWNWLVFWVTLDLCVSNQKVSTNSSGQYLQMDMLQTSIWYLNGSVTAHSLGIQQFVTAAASKALSACHLWTALRETRARVELCTPRTYGSHMHACTSCTYKGMVGKAAKLNYILSLEYHLGITIIL